MFSRANMKEKNAINLIRHDPWFIQDSSDFHNLDTINALSVITNDKINPYKFHFIDKKHDNNNSICRTFHVLGDGTIGIYDGTEPTQESIETYLFDPEITAIYKKILATGFYTQCAERFSNNCVRLEHKITPRDNKKTQEILDGYLLTIKRDGTLFYTSTGGTNPFECHGTLRYQTGSSRLLYITEIEDSVIQEFHQQHIAPVLDLSCSRPTGDRTFESFMMTLDLKKNHLQKEEILGCSGPN